MTERWVRRKAAAWLILGALVAAQFVPLLSRLGYESAIALNAILLILGVPLVVGRLRGGGEALASAHASSSPWFRWVTAMLILGAWAVVGLALSIVNALRVPICDWGTGLEYWVLFGIGGVPLLSMLAVLSITVRRRSAAYATLVLIPFVSVASTLWHLYSQPPIVAYDLFFGYFAGSIYDESLVDSGMHWMFRLQVTLFAVGAVALLDIGWAASRARSRRVVVDLAVAMTALLVAGTVLVHQASKGLHVTRAVIEESLGLLVETEHFEIHASRSAFNSRQLRLLVADHEARYDELVDFWGVEPDRPLRSYVYGSRAEKGRLMGGRATLVAKVWLNEMHIVWAGPGDGLLAHEMSHLFLRKLGVAPLQLPAYARLIPWMGIVEGSATAAAWSSRTLTPHGWAAAMLRLDMLPDISKTLVASRFWAQPSGVAYTALGSFSRWLIDRYGIEAYRRLYAEKDFLAATGKPVGALVDEWKRMLETVPLSDAALDEARLAFDRPSIFRAKCPRAGAGWVEDAERAAMRGDAASVLRHAQRLARENLLQREALQRVATALIRARQDDVARGILVDAAESDETPVAQKQRARLQLADIAWQHEEVDGARRWLFAMEREPMSEDLQRAAFVRQRAFELPQATQALVREYLRAGASTRWPTLVAMSAAASGDESGVLPYLVGLRMADEWPEAPTGGFLSFAASRLVGTPVYRRALRELAYHRVTHGERSGCNDWRELRAMSRSEEAYAAEAELWLRRCEHDWWPWAALGPGSEGAAPAE